VKVYRELARRAGGGEACALATVIATEGSSPAEAAMKMLVGAGGRLLGTVGGGRVEAEIEKKAGEVLESGRAEVVSFVLDDALADSGGMICGGTVRILVERVAPPAAWASRAVEVAEAGRRAALIARLGERVERTVLEGDSAAHYLAREDPRLEEGLFVEPLLFVRCIILGAGHVGRAVARVADVAGLRPVVVEDREEQARKAEAVAHRVVCADLVAGFSSLRPGPDDFVVVMTRTHGLDLACVRAALLSPARYVGMLASRRKAGAIRTALAEEGLEAERLHAPVGLDLKATSAGEIAVSVVAQLVKVRRLGRGDR